MADAATVSRLAKAAKSYAKDVGALIAAGSTTEATYSAAVKSLIGAALAIDELPFDVRINTGEQKVRGGLNHLDVALYDGACLDGAAERSDKYQLLLATGRS